MHVQELAQKTKVSASAQCGQSNSLFHAFKAKANFLAKQVPMLEGWIITQEVRKMIKAASKLQHIEKRKKSFVILWLEFKLEENIIVLWANHGECKNEAQFLQPRK